MLLSLRNWSTFILGGTKNLPGEGYAKAICRGVRHGRTLVELIRRQDTCLVLSHRVLLSTYRECDTILISAEIERCAWTVVDSQCWQRQTGDNKVSKKNWFVGSLEKKLVCRELFDTGWWPREQSPERQDSVLGVVNNRACADGGLNLVLSSVKSSIVCRSCSLSIYILAFSSCSAVFLVVRWFGCEGNITALWLEVRWFPWWSWIFVLTAW